MQKITLNKIEGIYNYLGQTNKRTKRMSRLINKFFESIDFDNGCDSFTRKELENSINKIAKPKRKIRVLSMGKKDRRKCEAFQDYVFDDNGNLKYLTIELPIKRGKYKKENFPVVIHEFTHAIHALNFPKIVKRLIKTDRRVAQIDSKQLFPSLDKRYDQLYKRYLNHEETFESQDDIQEIIAKQEIKLKKLLSGLSATDKIDIIQNLRYTLESEYYANQADNQIAEIMKKKNIKCSSDYDNSGYNEFLFKEKLDMLTRVGFDTIQKERANLRKYTINYIQ